MNAHKKLTDEQGRGNERLLLYWKKLKRGTPIFSWFPLEMTSVRGQRAAIELKMKDKIQTKVQLKGSFELELHSGWKLRWVGQYDKSFNEQNANEEDDKTHRIETYFCQ